KPVHLAQRVTFGHLLMNDAPSRCHPLDVTGGDGAVVSHAIAVLDRSREHIRDRFDAAVRMPRKAGQVIVWNIVAEIIQKQKRVEIRSITEAKCSAQMHACAFERWLGLDQPLDWPKGHVSLQCLESDYARLLLF